MAAAATARRPAADTGARFGGADLLRAADPRLAGTIERVEEAIAELWRTPPRAPHRLHDDFAPRNVIVDGDRHRPIDFHDVAHGFAAPDVAVTAARLAPHEVAALRAGYENVRPGPEVAPELWRALVAGRFPDVMAVALAAPAAPIAAAYAPSTAKLRRWLGDGS